MSKPGDSIKSRFVDRLNGEGYALQYAALSAAHNLFDSGNRTWAFVASEFPVLADHSTRVDFVLRNRREDLYLLCECKRANPALRNWCFARAPYVRRNRTDEYLFIEVLEHNGEKVTSAGERTNLQQDFFHIAVEVRSNEKGYEFGKGRGEIEKALSQVLRGLNGFASVLAQRPNLVKGTQKRLLPVIVTTAHLWATSAKLEDSSLSDGTIVDDEVELTEVQSIWFQYVQSPSLRHNVPVRATREVPLETILDRDFVRSVAFVKADYLSEFLKGFYDEFETSPLM